MKSAYRQLASYGKEDPEGNTYLVHIYDRSLMIKMLSDPKIEKTVHLYV